MAEKWTVEQVVARMRAIADLLDAPRIRTGLGDVIDTADMKLSAVHLDVAEALGWPILVRINGQRLVIRNVALDRAKNLEAGLQRAGYRVMAVLPMAQEIEVSSHA